MKIIRPVSITTSGSFSRASGGTYFDRNGALQVVGVNVPRLDHDPITKAPRGLLVESAATNYYSTNSDVASPSLVLPLPAGTYTLSFYGTGTVTLSAGATGTLVGTGAWPVRSSLTFTCTGGCTVTATGTVEKIQIESGSVATSYIPTSSGIGIRAADIVDGTGLIYTDVDAGEYPEWNPGTSYNLQDRVEVTADKAIYENIQAGTNSTAPSLATTRWIKVSATNPWRLFDDKINTETSKLSSFTYILKPGRISGFALLNSSATFIEVSMVVPGQPDPVVFSGSANLTDGTVVGDWYEYFFEPVEQVDSFVIAELIDSALPNIPQYQDGILCVTVYYDGGTAKAGAMIVGLVADLGLTQYDSSVGIIDYSKQDTDQFGNISIVQRTFSKRMNVDVHLRNEKVDSVVRMLSQYRSTPIVWIGMDNVYTSMIIYGYYKDWDLVLAGASHSTCRIQINGLT